jgi:aminopeptidase-like protein
MAETMDTNGERMYELMKELWPIPRSITGQGVRDTLSILKRELPKLQIIEVPSGTKCFDWIVPKEWNILDAYIISPNGEKIIDFKKTNLHVVGYSTPVTKTIALDELQDHLYTLPALPEAIPYVTSFYEERWGFCLSENQRSALKPGEYQVLIDSELKEGHLTYGELLVPGESKQEIFLSTYVCHPSLANNELSGPVVACALAKWIQAIPSRNYSYRIIFIPETIGSITYLSRNLQAMKENVIAGYNITCVGDDRAFSYLPSRATDTIADQVALHTLKHYTGDNFITYSYLDRGSDERQYCSPGVDLPVASVMRTKYEEYPEYHTSLDNMDVVSPAGLFGAYSVLRLCVDALENNAIYQCTVNCEPQLGKRGLYPTLSTGESSKAVKEMMDLIAYCDGTHDLISIAEKIGVPIWNLYNIVERLAEENLLEKV